MRQSLWVKDYDVNTIVLNSQKRLGLTGLLNLLQDIAWLHAEHLGWGYEDLIKRNTIWVLVRQKLVMSDWPVWGDVVTIKTWPRGVAGVLAIRDFEISVGGRLLGQATTTWLTLNWETRRPQKFDRDAFKLEGQKAGLGFEAGKILPRSGLKPVASYEVRNSDLDVNGHVNNTRYAQWITDTMTDGDLAAHAIAEYEVNFLAETRVGDTVEIERDDASPSADGIENRHYQGRRKGDDKPAFLASLVLTPR